MASTPSSQEPKASRSRVRRALALIVAVLFVALLAFGLLSKAANKSVDESLAKGVAPPAPGFDDSVLERGNLPQALRAALGPVLAAGQLDIAALRGTPFVLNFWASWCIPCREEAPILRAGWDRFGRQGVLYLGLNMQDLIGDARDFVARYGLSYPTVREPSDATAREYGVTGIPETFFVTARGRIVGHVIGVVNERQLIEGSVAARDGHLVGTQAGGALGAQR